MITFISIFIFLFGLIVGSFLNVVIYRYNTGLSINGRSKCLSCNRQLKWYELVPVFSFLFQRAKCSKCGSKISWQYPLVELGTGTLFFLLYISMQDMLMLFPKLAITIFLLEAVIGSLLVVIFVYDLKHKIIPNELVYSFSFISLIHLFLITPPMFYKTNLFIWNLLAGPILFLPFYILWRVSNGRWIGLGDGKLALGIGWLLGLTLGISALIISFWLGAIFSLVLLLVFRLKQGSKNITMKTEVPFAPFLIIGTLVVFFFGIDVLSLNLLFNL